MSVNLLRSLQSLAWLVLMSCWQIQSASAAETVVYSEGFEAGNGGFTLLEAANPAAWQWGTPAASPGPGTCHGGAKCWGTNFGRTMPRPTDGSIVSPAITLPPLDAGKTQVIRVRFWAFVSLDGMRDRGQFFVSKDQVNWESLAQMYNNMETSPATTPQWHKYEFSINSAYAGGPIFLRFRAAANDASSSFYCGGTDDLSGVYLDDLAITYYDVTGDQKVFNMEAWEDASAWASCPWVAPWNGSSFQVDNDIYSVARTAAGEYRDYYRLGTPLVAKGGVYPIEVQEREAEDSYTDYVRLIQVDHAPGVAVAPDQAGVLHAYVPSQLLKPNSAVAAGTDVLSLVATADDNGYPAYNGDTVDVHFGNANVANGALVVLRVAGFVVGQGTPQAYSGPPAIVVETQDIFGQWQERGRLWPRFAYSWGAFDISPFVVNGQDVRVRLRSVSHDVKYHAIDYVALYAGAAPSFGATETAPTLATFAGQDVLARLLAADGNYVATASGEKFYMEFPVAPLAAPNVREFVFVSQGYYVPKGGSYLIYTWDGTDWVQRDGSTYPASDTSKSFDLSLFQPDPSGEYKVRIWQDYQYEAAGIDYVNMMVGATQAPLNYAWDFRSSADILSLLQASDNNRITWSYCPRNRVVEVHFTPPGPSNVPPTTNPVGVTNLTSLTPTISWTYNDANGDAQALAQVQVWTGPGATGSIVWNPAVFAGAGTSQTYAGSALSFGATYYARVQANDGKDWGAWSEAAFTLTRPTICGDLNGDGLVNNADYLIFRAALNKRAGQPGFVAAADMDGDGVITLKDYAKWYACFVANR
jgi:hypothetical protein